MKNIIIGAASFVICLLLLFTVYTLQGRENRSEEIHDGITNAMTAAGEQMKENGSYGSDEEFSAAFIENLMQQMDSASNMEVSILKADSGKGILSAEVTQTYRHPNGKEGKVSCMRTLILDREDETLRQEQKSHVVSFYTERDVNADSLYKTSLLTEGEKVKVPKAPEKEGYVFLEWRDAATGQSADFTEEVFEEKVFYAVWKEA